ncbi:MAG TPA: TrmH family RNA methyltransferase [Candidatus Sulfotelmatobacter sp.]|jgi:TrmH family RNA methyltransferase|nr:TrmH family RNA methyltransferase [Candidatus Sulfotelmatobacter sp.]
MKNLCVVLVGTRNPLNVGAVARAMSNFGAMELRAVRPYEKAWRDAKSAVGAGELLARAEEFASLAEAVADCSLVVGTTAVGNREMKHPLRGLEDGARLIGKRMETGRVAVLFGSEKWGLSNEDLSYCHWLMRIPTRVEHRSMNLGQAAAVVMYELGRIQSKRKDNAEARRTQRFAESGREKTAPLKPKGAAPKSGRMEEFAEIETVERIGEALLEALRKSGYVAARGEAKAEEKLRRMLRRFSMQAADAEVFLGMVRKILWKLEQDG